MYLIFTIAIPTTEEPLCKQCFLYIKAVILNSVILDSAILDFVKPSLLQRLTEAIHSHSKLKVIS